MRVEVISSVNEARADRFTHRTAIVIDVLRATSTIVAALQAGSSGIYTVETVLDARALQRPADLLAGERFCRKIPGFDLGNSPDEFTPEMVQDRRIILTTTNGTRGLHKAVRADHVLAGSLLNLSACTQAALDLRRDIVLLCSGSHDEFALEDGLCAGAFVAKLQAGSPDGLEMDDFAAAMLGFYRNSTGQLYETLASGATGRRLLKLGMARDIKRCSQLDSSDIVARMQGGMLTRG
ncbi:2-phosphosulfolactate phosphatase [Paenibacillus nasutitermitis]|uniref:Probable 2-phosphosulfolactate phosphatase n=1 Tax=Paenibacillus nasutitermitis TaxID=1652958 RepID=A0A916Z0N3_9BACL|nr:2-phosphosulfolactate phosphatase [Paenibacillus nasutitermitis]GGD70184.1 putative 2-phosphosulfolactate phosphatase [Paenibacillus nasutitermitis]